MKAYADSTKAIMAARKVASMVAQLDGALYVLDGEIPNDAADQAIKNARRHVAEACKSIAYVAGGMWAGAVEPIQGPAEGPDDAPNPWQMFDDIKAGGDPWAAHPDDLPVRVERDDAPGWYAQELQF